MNSLKDTSQKTWGLYDKSSQIAIPLKSLHASVSIVNTISRVKYTQNYYNDSDKFIETEFFFPISSDACFDSFEATFNDTTIRGVIKKKQQAQEEYKEAITQGRTAAYSEINEETGDIMKIMIGNIPPKTTVAITYSYIQKLEVAANRFLCFRLFSTITPRYNGNLQDALKADIALLFRYPTISSQDPEAYPWTIEAEIQSASPISFVKSPSHNITPAYGNENHTCKITFKSNEPQYPKKDFILLYTNENKQDKIDYVLTPFEEGYCAMVNLRADFQTSPNEKVYENLVKAKEIESEYSIDEAKGEFIFLIDRSGSMSGGRIEMARDSLVLFLKSLPQDSWFDVVSFGDSYRSLNGVSLKYSQESLEKSVKQVERFQADMGGTEIYDALNQIFNVPIKTGYPRSVFLLTDGAVSNTSEVLNLIKANSDKSKVFTIGIGNGCSQQLITQGAAYGRGKHEFVASNSEVYEKVINLLNASLSPCYSDISLESNNFDAVVKALTPNPSSIPLLLDGQTLTFFLFLRSEAFTNDNKMSLKLNMNDSRSHQRRSIDIVLDTNEAIQNDLIPKLAVHDMIRRLETDKTNIVWMSKEDIKENLVELSLKHGVLCKETAFFCETEKSNVKTIQETQKIKIVIPTSLSHDYSFLSGAIQRRFQVLRKASASSDNSEDDEDDEYCEECEEGGLQVSSNLYENFSYKPQEDYLCDKRDNSNPCNSFSPLSQAFQSSAITVLPDSVSTKTSTSMSSKGSYLQVVKKQKFEGFWDPQDSSIYQTILKNGALPEIPEQIKNIDASLAQTIWLTLLVLLWLETACQSERKAWLLIYQKGMNWLKKVGVNYEETKSLGASEVKAQF